MKHLLNRTGDKLTECLRAAARRDELTVELDEMTCRDCRTALIDRGVCPECGEEKLAWGAGPVKLNTVAGMLLRLHEVETQFHLCCEGCSETLIHSVTPDQVVQLLNAVRWRP